MIVRVVWRKEDETLYWVEATLEEARDQIFPHISPEAIEAAFAGEARCRNLIEAYKERYQLQLYPFCFLVSQDLSSIEPFHASYPFDNLWCGYSPFEDIPEREISSLNELKGLA